ncbi:hypothetical protein CLOM_g20001 [Closterium sp. NIES-68]|nr:hypothetical protein CLOM_g20001 [Closterium sp. NIES-68]GJP61030.1 hypothetical protein CLOP_g18243 [Closterium sp. NIES-67]
MAKKEECETFQTTSFNVDFPSPPPKRLCIRSSEALFGSKAWTRTQPLVDLNALPCEAAIPPMSTTSVPSLGDLGEDLLLHILQLAQPTAWDLSRFACVNRSWRNLCYNPIFWTKLRIGPGSMRAGVEQLASRCAHLTELHIDDPRCELHVLHPIIMACGPSLRRVVIDCDRDDTSRNEASICSVLWIVSLYCLNVESVELVSNGEKGNFNYLENKAMWYLTSGFRRVRSFACLCKNSLTKQAIYLMVIAWRELAYLRIHCGALAKDDLMALRKCYALRVLELIGGNLRQLFGENSVATDAVMHRDLNTIALTNMVCDVDDIAKLSMLLPSLQRIIIRKSSLATSAGDDVATKARAVASLREWLAARKNIMLVIDE